MLKENNTKRHFYIEEVILILLLTLSLVGVRITDYSPVDGYGYCFEVKSEYKPQCNLHYKCNQYMKLHQKI